MYKSMIFALTSVVALTSAIPTPVELAPRSYATEYSVTIQPIDSASPDQSFAPTNNFVVSQKDGSATHPGGRNVDALVAINNIPAGATGCQLEVFLPESATINTSGAAKLNVYALAAPFNAQTTWNGRPKSSSLFGTVVLKHGRSIVNSGACAPNLYYLFQIESDTADGSAAFSQSTAPLPTGVRLTHNC